MGRRTAAVALAVVLPLLLAGCAGVGGAGDGGGRTVNPALAHTPSPAPTPTPAPDYPPGVTADGVDAVALAAAHDGALAGRRSVATFERTVVAANGTTLSTTRSVIESAGDRLRFRIVTTGDRPGEPPSPVSSLAFWTNGSVTAIRTETATGAVDYRYVPGRPRAVAEVDDSGEGLVRGALAGTGARPVGTTVADGETLYVLRADRAALDRIGEPTARDLAVVASVTREGVVRSYERRFAATYDTAAGTVAATTTERFRVSLGGTDAAPPAWVSEARAEAEGTDDGAGDGADGES